MTTKEKIENVLWNACNSFRGKLDSGRFKDYLLSMLFIKYLSDWSKQVHEDLEVNVKSESRRQILLDNGKYKVPQEATFEYLYDNKKDPRIGELINDAKNLLQDNNPEKLNGIFGNIDFNSTDMGSGADKIATLSNLLEEFKQLDLTPNQLENNDVIGDAYMYLLSQFASDAGKKGGEFYTPAEVSELLSQIVEPVEGETIYDPTCGSGSLLIKAFYRVQNRNKAQIYGQERNFQTWSLSRMNMYLHQIDDAIIWRGDTISEPGNVEEDRTLMKFDCIVANPPFSLDKWSNGFDNGEDNKEFKFANAMDKYSRFEWGVPPRSKGDYAFILHMINSLSHRGRMAVVMPHGVLFRGASEGQIRKQMISHNLLEAVIGLPSNLFYGTSIPTCILVLNKRKKNTDILFIDSSKEFVAEKKQNKLSEDNVKKIVETYKEKATVDKYSRVVTLDEIKENDYNLNIPRYVDTFEDEEEIDIQQVLKEIKQLESERDELSKEIDVYLKELGIIQ